MAHRRRRAVAVGTLALCAAAWPSAEAARFPNIVRRTFVFRGPSARAFARLLHLPADQASTVRLELSQFDEHSALPERDAALRDPRGTLPSNLSWRLSDRVRTTVTWKPRPALLEIDGYVRDLSTAGPRPDGPACLVYSPDFSETELDQLPGWKPLVLALRALPAKPGQGVVLESRRPKPAGAEVAGLDPFRPRAGDDTQREVRMRGLRVPSAGRPTERRPA
jgi:hypothetical protein